MLARAIVAFGLASGLATGGLLAQQPAHGPQGQPNLVVSDSTSFWIAPPDGWVFDAESGKREGLLAVFYRKGQSWRTAEPLMHASVITRKIGYNAVIPAAIRSDSANWAGTAKDFVFVVRDSVRTNSGVMAHLRSYRSVSSKQFDTVAYYQGDERTWMITLTARSLAAHDAAYADFMALVKSFAPGPDQKP
ncbi:MAG TPA: hypothetical protein VE967_01185 [Gemmatimonadaceae bacterium]|nr:hypothetical protein [Gemmatimonadaceae bacterium]